MKKLPVFLLALSVVASSVSLTRCDKKVKPGDVKGYDEGEEYISMWCIQSKIHLKARRTKNQWIVSMKRITENILLILNLFQETIAAAVIRIKSMHRNGIFRTGTCSHDNFPFPSDDTDPYIQFH